MISGAVLFTLAASGALLSASPGAGAIAVFQTGISGTLKQTTSFILGLELGYIVQITLSVTGIALFFAAFPSVYLIFRILGALYLLYLAGAQWFAAPRINLLEERHNSRYREHLFRAFLINATNPKATIFLSAFIPQFIRIEASLLPQLVVISSVLVLVDMAIMAIYGFSGRKISILIKNEKTLRLFNRTASAILVIVVITLFL